MFFCQTCFSCITVFPFHKSFGFIPQQWIKQSHSNLTMAEAYIYIYMDHVAIKNNFFITEDEKVSISFWEMRKFSCTIESFNPITTVPCFFFLNKWIEKCKTKGIMNKEKGVCYALGFLRYNVCMIPKWQVGENNSLDGCKTLQMM